MNPITWTLALAGALLAIIAILTTAAAFLADKQRPRSLTRWVRSWWLEVPEPREISVIYCAVYVTAGLTGLSIILAPPLAIDHIASGPVVAGVGGFFILGALAAAIGGARENWRVERLGLVLLAAALLGYAVLVWALQPSTPGAKLAAIGLVSIAASVLILRWVLIRGYSHRPRR